MYNFVNFMILKQKVDLIFFLSLRFIKSCSFTAKMFNSY